MARDRTDTRSGNRRPTVSAETQRRGRPTVYTSRDGRRFQMRSRLEAGFAAWLDESGCVDWDYEPCAYATAEGQYLPDFVINNLWSYDYGEVVKAFVEVKPPLQPSELVTAAERMA